MSGLDFLGRVRAQENHRKLAVVVLASSNEEQDMQIAYAAGANSCLRKPVDFDAFLTLIGHVQHYWLELNKAPNDD